MVRSKNAFHTIQLIAGILFAVYLLMNLNSLSGLREAGENVPGVTMKVSSQLANIGDRAQQVSEEGFLQSIVSKITGDGVTYSNADGNAEVVVEPPVESNTGGIGEWIEGAGEMFAQIWTSGETSMTRVKEVEQKDLPLVQEVTDAVEPFDHLSRPTITNIPVDEEHLDRIQQETSSTPEDESEDLAV